MKILKFTVFMLLACFTWINAKAQGKYGKTPEDSIQCILDLQSYQTEYRSSNYDIALVPWRKVFQNCPGASQNFYVHGVTMMRDLIGKTSDPAMKKARIDTLLMLYDMRLKYFSLKEDVKKDLYYRRAIDVQTYKPDDNKAIYEAYKIAIENNKDIDLIAAAKVMLAARELFEKNEITLEEFTDAYTTMSELADYQLKKDPQDTVKPQIKAGIEGAFLTTDAANCENLTKVLEARFNANKNNAEVVKMVVSLLTTKECTDNQLYYDGVEAYNKISPSPAASYGLARMYYSKNDKDKANQYFKEAVDTETDQLNKSKYYQEFGALYLKEKNIGQTINYARQSIAANPKNGKAYYVLGMAYAQVTGCGDDEVSKSSVYWIAVDQLVKAKQLDPSLAAEANKSISLFSQHFPLQGDAFFLDLLDGQKYTVKCGPINETTVVRTRKP
ncbi:MAG: hypothetical protein LBG92_00605 [Prevotellaceae bacterium]|jgi:tetratricopeptide (TPR) repeat protein|nr:hypothetical protein [Prevotellaceae bacterium]